MKTQRFRATKGRSLEDILEECQMLGYDAELDGDEVVVYLNPRSKKDKGHKKANKIKSEAGQREHWSKRERNFGYTRGQ